MFKSYGPYPAVIDVSFEVLKGEIVGFLGPNGAGKSTTMRMLAGCLEPDAGSASLSGFDSSLNRRKAQSYLGYLPEGAPAYPAMTPRGFVRFHLRARGFSGPDLKAAELHALDRARVGAASDKPIATLSKGYKRRAALAAAIAHDPPILILDEPTDGLDPNQKDGVRSLIREMAAHKAIIISTHLLDEVDAICTRAMVIADGRILADETPGGLAALGEDGTIGSAFRVLTRQAHESIAAKDTAASRKETAA